MSTPVTRTLLVALLAAVGIAPVSAATFRVDDGASMPLESATPLRWRQFAPSRSNDNVLEGAMTIAVRLNLAPWMNRNGRIFLVLPEQGTAPVRVSWLTQGRLLPGEISPGMRVLVYAGPVAGPILEETIALKIEADGTRLPGMQRLRFHFEIDTD
jgi:hypothetical protein